MISACRKRYDGSFVGRRGLTLLHLHRFLQGMQVILFGPWFSEVDGVEVPHEGRPMDFFFLP